MGCREVVRKEIKLCFPPTKFTSQEAQGILPLFLATRILKNWDRASSCCLCKWNCSLFHTQWGLNLYAHYLQQQVAVMSPSPWQCWWSQVLEKDQGSPAELHHAPTGQRYVTSPQLIFLSACSHHPYTFPLLQVGCLRTLSPPGVFGNINNNNNSDKMYSNHPF